MSPAPVRERASVDRFPHSWGYGLGALLVIAGSAVAVWGVVSGVNGFRNDVNDLRRIFDTEDAQGNRLMEEAVKVPRNGRGRPKKRPLRLIADKGYDAQGIRQYLRRRGIPKGENDGSEGRPDRGRYRLRQLESGDR